MTKAFTKAVLLCTLIILGPLPDVLSQPTASPPGTTPTMTPTTPVINPPVRAPAMLPPAQAPPPTTTTTPPAQAPRTATPPALAPTNVLPTPRAPAPAPATTTPTMRGPAPAPMTTTTTTPARAPAPGPTTTTARAPAPGPTMGAIVLPRTPAPAPAPGLTALGPNVAPLGGLPAIVSPAQGPALRGVPAPAPDSVGAINATISFLSPGALSTDQQLQLCTFVIGSVAPSFPTVLQCAVSGQSAAASPSFTITGRRLQQQVVGGTFPLTVNLVLAGASRNQAPGIQAILNNLKINIGTTPATPITVINFIILIINVFPANPTNPNLPPGVPMLPNTNRITPGMSGGTPGSVITVVPGNARGTTTMNVPTSQARPPATPMGGSTTTTTIRNATHTTTTTTIAVFVIATQVTTIQQFFFTIIIGGTTGTFTIITFDLPGNVVFNIPTSITGGAAPGRSTTVIVLGQTVQTVIAQTTITTTTTTTTSTTGNAGTGAGGNANVASVCQTPTNPLGAIQITANEGTLVKGAFLVSAWGNAAGVVGQGSRIFQCMPSGQSSVWADIKVTGACATDNAGVGLTGALSKCGNLIIAGSLPLANGKANPGCLIALDTKGSLVAEVKSPGINGPWGSVCTTSGSQITLAISSVLGGLAPAAPAMAASGGRRLMQANSTATTPTPAAASNVTDGFVARWTFAAPTTGGNWTLGTPTFLASGLSTNPGSVSSGDVAPGLLTVDGSGMMYIPSQRDGRILTVPNGLTTTATTGQSVLSGVNGTVTSPTSVFFANGQLLGSNADGTIFSITVGGNGTASGNPTTIAVASPGALNQALLSTDNSAGAPVNSILFTNALQGGFNIFRNATAPGPAPGLSTPNSRPAMAPVAGK